MKTILFLLLFVGVAAEGQIAKLESENNHSTIEFFVPISDGLTKISGKFTDYHIDIQFTDSSLLKSKIEVRINPASITTGIAARDEDLKTKDFFDVTNYPVITFVSDQIVKNKDQYVVKGKCTLHGVTKEIEIPFTVTGVRKNYVIGFSGVLKLKRSDYAIGTNWKHTTDDKFIGDEIEVHIDFWTRKSKKG
jgi:polyisoprenoid-binding protein YceI